MNHGALLALADRVEKANGADREIDAKIAREVGAIPPNAAYEGTIKMDDRAWSNGCGYVIPAFTGSLDAAKTLVREKWVFEVRTRHDGMATARLSPRGDLPYEPVTAEAETPENALTATALRALAQMEEGADG